jgi:anti-sigma B factor antagonist
MEIGIKEYKGAKVLSVTGDIDMHSSPGLRKELLALVGSRIPLVVVDFREVSYIDSSGIATFVEGLKGAKTYGGELKFAGIPPRIGEIFSFSKLDKVFLIYGNIEDAVGG